MSAEPPLSGTAEVGGGGRSVTVLVADDNEVTQRLCRRVLEKAGHKVLTASDGLEAVSLALANSPDMVLLDDAMPGMNSLEAMRQIKEQRPGMAIVIASVHPMASDRERFLAVGADDVLSKPFRLSDLTAVVAKFTANRGPAPPVPPAPAPSEAYAPAPPSTPAEAAATAMARATTALGQMAAASGGFMGTAGMLPTIHGEGSVPAGATRRIQAVIESLITRKGLNLRLAPAVTQAFEGAELKASDYAGPIHISKESAGRELRQAVEAGVLQVVRNSQGEAGFRAGPDLLRSVAEGLGQQVNASQPLTPETIIGSLSVGQTEGTVTIMFTDMEGSTNLLSTRGFTESHEIMKAYESIIDEKAGEHAGRRIKGLGDVLMVSFDSSRHGVESSRHGVECALDIQKAIAEYSKQNPQRKIRIRIGINTGEVVEEAGDIFGAAVNVAAQVAGKAKDGEILVSDVVRHLVGPVADIVFEYRGAYKLKGFPDRWRLHKVTASGSTWMPDAQ